MFILTCHKLLKFPTGNQNPGKYPHRVALSKINHSMASGFPGLRLEKTNVRMQAGTRGKGGSSCTWVEKKSATFPREAPG